MIAKKPEFTPDGDKSGLAAVAAAEFALWKKELDAKREGNLHTKEIINDSRPEIDVYGMNGIIGLGQG